MSRITITIHCPSHQTPNCDVRPSPPQRMYREPDLRPWVQSIPRWLQGLGASWATLRAGTSTRGPTWRKGTGLARLTVEVRNLTPHTIDGSYRSNLSQPNLYAQCGITVWPVRVKGSCQQPAPKILAPAVVPGHLSDGYLSWSIDRENPTGICLLLLVPRVTY